jgi:hypothetical protein
MIVWPADVANATQLALTTCNYEPITTLTALPKILLISHPWLFLRYENGCTVINNGRFNFIRLRICDLNYASITL